MCSAGLELVTVLLLDQPGSAGNMHSDTWDAEWALAKQWRTRWDVHWGRTEDSGNRKKNNWRELLVDWRFLPLGTFTDRDLPWGTSTRTSTPVLVPVYRWPVSDHWAKELTSSPWPGRVQMSSLSASTEEAFWVFWNCGWVISYCWPTASKGLFGGPIICGCECFSSSERVWTIS